MNLLVGVVEAEVGRDYPDARLFQPLGDLLQVGGVDAGHLERIDPFGSWCRVEKPAEACFGSIVFCGFGQVVFSGLGVGHADHSRAVPW